MNRVKTAYFADLNNADKAPLLTVSPSLEIIPDVLNNSGEGHTSWTTNQFSITYLWLAGRTLVVLSRQLRLTPHHQHWNAIYFPLICAMFFFWRGGVRIFGKTKIYLIKEIYFRSVPTFWSGNMLILISVFFLFITLKF